MIKNIVIKTIKHNEHRYPTTGDWWVEGDTLQIRSSECGDWRASMVVAVHEAVEALTCIENGVEPEALDRFDKNYEIIREAKGQELVYVHELEAERKLRAEFGGHDAITDWSEPGDDLHAPYRHQHALATQVEHILTEGMNLPWSLYEEELSALEDDNESTADSVGN